MGGHREGTLLDPEVHKNKELTHVTARAAAHFPMVPPPSPPPFRVMVARPAQVTQVTRVPITLTQHDGVAAPCDTTHPMWWHHGTARPEPPPPPRRGWVSSQGDILESTVGKMVPK